MESARKHELCSLSPRDLALLFTELLNGSEWEEKGIANS